MAVVHKTYMESINPATEQVLGRFPLATQAEIDQALDRSRWAFRRWRDADFAERAAYFRRAAEYLRTNKARLAKIITLEMGKPVVEAEAEVEKCAWGCEYFANNAAGFLSDEPRTSNAKESYVTFEPLGTVFGVMPWNYPMWQVFRFAAPAIMAGNTVVVKHASNVPQSALAIEEVFRHSGFPEGVYKTLLISGQTAEELIADPRIAAVTLTGSEEAGSRVAAAAGRAIKKSVLELGGSDPFIVLADADIATAATVAARARNQNTGQTCIAAKRIIVVDSVFDEFADRFADAVSRLRVGDPMDRNTQVGPLARGDLREALERQLRESVEMGARVLVGGKRLDRPGYFFQPTVVSNVTPDMPVYREETFGPLAALIRVRNAEEAIAAANDTTFGLSSALWTQDIQLAKVLARQIEAGSVFINSMSSSDPRLPFGGVKRSGYGRELSEFGIHEFVNIKSVSIGRAS